MAARLCIFLALVACAHAGFVGYGAPAYTSQIVSPALTSQQSNIYRGFGNLGQVSTYSKSIDTPFSSVRKSDIRVSNPGFGAYAAPAYAAPAYAAHAIAAPAYASHAIAAPAYAAPVVAPKVVGAGLLGVAYSAAPVVSHMSYSNALGLSYAW